MSRTWTAVEVRALGVRTTGVIACEIVYGVGRTKAYELLAAGAVDFPTIRRGRTYIVPVSALLRLLDLTPETSEAGPYGGPAVASTPKGVLPDDRYGTRPRPAAA